MIKSFSLALFDVPTGRDVSRLIKVLLQIWNRITNTIKDPLAHPRETVLIIGILVVIFLILITLLLMVFVFKQEIERKPPHKRESDKELRARSRKIYLVLASIIIVLFVFSMIATSQSSFCSSCHVIKKNYQSWEKSSHKKAGCLSCHAEPGVFGYLLARLRGFSNLSAFVNESYRLPLRSIVKNSSCLMCHQPRLSKTISTRGIKVSHKEINQAGFLCIECHPRTGHNAKVAINMMDKCITCHNAQHASSECVVCHPIDIAYDPSLTFDDFPKIQLGEPGGCRGCHSPALEKKCLACHGIEMPHTGAFIGGGHARLGFVNKTLCYRCHDRKMCVRCHLGVDGHTGDWRGSHGSGWITEHQDRQASQCLGGPCHGPNICDLCHSK